MTPWIIRTPEDDQRFKQREAARMHWCLAEVNQMHGDTGALRHFRARQWSGLLRTVRRRGLSGRARRRPAAGGGEGRDAGGRRPARNGPGNHSDTSPAPRDCPSSGTSGSSRIGSHAVTCPATGPPAQAPTQSPSPQDNLPRLQPEPQIQGTRTPRLTVPAGYEAAPRVVPASGAYPSCETAPSTYRP